MDVLVDVFEAGCKAVRTVKRQTIRRGRAGWDSLLDALEETFVAWLNPASASPVGAPAAGVDPVGVEQPPAPPTGMPVDVIAQALADHQVHLDGDPELEPWRWVCCGADGSVHDCFPGQGQWRRHVVPIIAARLESAASESRHIADQFTAAGFEAANTFEQHKK